MGYGRLYHLLSLFIVSLPPCGTQHASTTSTFEVYFSTDKPIGASPGRDYEDGISTKNLVLNILWCRAGNYHIEKGGERSAGYGLIERF